MAAWMLANCAFLPDSRLVLVLSTSTGLPPDIMADKEYNSEINKAI